MRRCSTDCSRSVFQKMREKEEKNHHKLANKSAQSKSGCFFFYLLRVPLFSVSVLASSKWTVHSSVCCETMRSATLAFIHRESHTQSCFLTHTCRGYERGYQYLQVNTFSSNTDISLCLAPPHSLPLCLSPVSLVRISVGVFIGCGAWVSLLADSNVTVSLMFL